MALFHRFFTDLRAAKIPVSTREYLTLLEALKKGAIEQEVDSFYAVSRAALVKDERNFDRFDKVFAHHFEGIEALGDLFKSDEIPEDWLTAQMKRHLTKEEMEALQEMDFDQLMKTLQERLKEQEKRHEGGNKWIGTGGTSPYGNSGWSPNGVRIGGKSKNKKASKVWENRRFKDLDSERELGTRNLKVALRRLRQFARDGAEEELDLEGTIRATANKGYLDVQMRPERRNAVKVLVFFDVGGSMDPYIDLTERLFSAARGVFKNLEYFYFHNFVYEYVWKDNRRRWDEKFSTWDVLHKYGADYKVVFVGDAAMAPYEITQPGGSVEHWNEEAGYVWMQRFMEKYKKLIWINPYPKDTWGYTTSTGIIRELVEDRMYPLTLSGLEDGMKFLAK